MNPIDYRNATFESLRGQVQGAMRTAALAAWRTHGPGTTEDVAQRAGLPILSFRPRTTELYQLGFIRLTDEQPEKCKGTYRVCTTIEHQAWFAEQQIAARNPQGELSFR